MGFIKYFSLVFILPIIIQLLQLTRDTDVKPRLGTLIIQAEPAVVVGPVVNERNNI